MEMKDAVSLIVKEHPNYKKERVEDVLCSLIDYQSRPNSLGRNLFDPEKCLVEESYLFLQVSDDLLALCKEKPGTLISSNVIEEAFLSTGFRQCP